MLMTGKPYGATPGVSGLLPGLIVGRRRPLAGAVASLLCVCHLWRQRLRNSQEDIDALQDPDRSFRTAERLGLC